MSKLTVPETMRNIIHILGTHEISDIWYFYIVKFQGL